MPQNNVRLHPHIFDPNAAASQDFVTPWPGRGKALSIQSRDRAQHAARLLSQLERIKETAEEHVAEQKAEGFDAGNGIYLQFDSDPGFDLKFESLESERSGIELCAVRRTHDNRTQATVFVPEGKLTFFLKRVSEQVRNLVFFLVADVLADTSFIHSKAENPSSQWPGFRGEGHKGLGREGV